MKEFELVRTQPGRINFKEDPVIGPLEVRHEVASERIFFPEKRPKNPDEMVELINRLYSLEVEMSLLEFGAKGQNVDLKS
jgi:hypothetical protein